MDEKIHVLIFKNMFFFLKELYRSLLSKYLFDVAKTR